MFIFLFFAAANSPTNVQAVQTPDSIVISWSPPDAGGATVTGYRIYYTLDDEMMNVSVGTNETQYSLDLGSGGTSYDDEQFFIHTVSMQLPSGRVNVTVTNSKLIHRMS